MHAIAEGWTTVGGTLREASETDGVSALPSYLDSASESVHELADGERTLYEDALAALDGAGPDP